MYIIKICSLISLFLIVSIHSNELTDKSASLYQKELNSLVHCEIDYLLWFSTQDGFHSPTVSTGDSPNLSSKWNSGVRAVLGAQPANWDIELCYTYYSTSSNDTVNANVETILTSTPSTAGIFEVTQKWGLHFNRLDLQLGRKLLLGNHFLFEPFLAIEGLDVSQNFKSTVNTAFLDLMTNLPSTNVVDSKNKNLLLGIGPRIGFKANFDFKAGFGLYGNCAINNLWGNFKIKQDYVETDYYSSRDSTILVDQIKKLSQGGTILNTDLEIGFSWRHLFQKPNLELLLKAAWEEHYYINIIRFQDFYLQQRSLGTGAYTTKGNLALSGLSVGVLLRY